MLFRPSFCANCGEKIDRTDWGLFTSRRFCPVCESEFKGQDLIPRFIVGAGILMGVFGLGGYLKSGTSVSEAQLIKQPRKLVDQAGVPSRAAPPDNAPPVLSNANISAPPLSQATVSARTETRMPDPPRPQRVPQEPAEELYFCGAKTAKGTPCKHRVKGNMRCFQHVGMPAMLSADELRIK